MVSAIFGFRLWFLARLLYTGLRAYLSVALVFIAHLLTLIFNNVIFFTIGFIHVCIFIF